MKKTRKYLVTGLSGQDGAILSKLLTDQGHKVYGMLRRTASGNLWRLGELDLLNEIEIVEGDLTDQSSLQRIVKLTKPDIILNTAAQSHVKVSFDQPIMTGEITGMGVLNLLETVRLSNFKDSIRLVQFSSSEMFGGTHNAGPDGKLNENTILDPMSPYACAKVFAHNSCRLYRKAYGMFVSTMIGFNHESEFRENTFVTRKITETACKIKLGLQDKIYLGNIEAGRDWSSAWDICDGIIKIANHQKPDDFVLGSGKVYKVKDFLKYSFEYLNLDYNDYLEIDPKFYRPAEVHNLLADTSKAEQILNWKPNPSIQELVERMVKADLKRLKNSKS